MNPNNDQQSVINPAIQQAVQPAQAPSAQSPLPAAHQPSETPKKGQGKGTILLAILILLIIGMAAYIVFAKIQTINAPMPAANSGTANKSEPTISPTLTPEEDIDFDSPEADLQNIESDLSSL